MQLVGSWRAGTLYDHYIGFNVGTLFVHATSEHVVEAVKLAEIRQTILT